MSATIDRLAEVQVQHDHTGISLIVPWEQADRWHARLRRHEIAATLHLDPAQREARIVPQPGIAIEHLTAVLADHPSQ